MISKIFVPTDGSDTAQKAVDYALELAKQLQASIIAQSVIDARSFVMRTVPPTVTDTHVPEAIEDYLRKAAQSYTDQIKDICAKNSVPCEVIISTGHPVEEIVKEAERTNTDLIVMGSHGRSALSAAILGSTTYGVINRESKIPVIVVKRELRRQIKPAEGIAA